MGHSTRPILRGFCSYGIVCKAVVDAALGGDTAKVARYQARFAGVVFLRRNDRHQHLAGGRHAADRRKDQGAGDAYDFETRR